MHLCLFKSFSTYHDLVIKFCLNFQAINSLIRQLRNLGPAFRLFKYNINFNIHFTHKHSRKKKERAQFYGICWEKYLHQH